MRFPLDVIAAICSVFGEGKVGVRISPFSTYQGMRERDPLALFVPYVHAILNKHPGLAYIHALEPRAMDTSDVKAEAIDPSDTLDPIRAICAAKNVSFITAGGWNAANAVTHSESYDDLVAFGRHFIGRHRSRL
jgi:NADPH2 dehydrogenase